MRMQKTDMEFVTFDAQDVIATSGSGYSSTVRFNGTISDQYNSTYGGFDFGSGTQGDVAKNPNRVYGYDAEKQNLFSNVWKADGTQHLGEEPNYADYSQANGDDISGYQLLSSVDEIVGWLTQFGKFNQ